MKTLLIILIIIAGEILLVICIDNWGKMLSKYDKMNKYGKK
jgi:hypothetical protein